MNRRLFVDFEADGYSLSFLPEIAGNAKRAREVGELTQLIFNAHGPHDWGLDFTLEQWIDKLFGCREKNIFNRLLTWRVQGRLVGMSLYAIGSPAEVFSWDNLPGMGPEGVDEQAIIRDLESQTKGRPISFFRRLGIIKDPKYRQHGRGFNRLADMSICDSIELGAKQAVMRTVRSVGTYRIFRAFGLRPVAEIGGEKGFVLYCTHIRTVWFLTKLKMMLRR